MKTVLKLIAVVILTITSCFATAQTYTYPTDGPKGYTLSSKTTDGVAVNYSLGRFSLSQLTYKGEVMSEISMSSIVLPNDYGCPNLPTESRFIAIPQGAKAVLNVVSFDKEVVKNVNIAPALRIQAEAEDPDMNYVKDKKVYETNAFYPANPFTVSEKTSLRGVDAVVLSITPFQYNPVTKELVVYSNIHLSVEFEGGNGHFGEDRLRSPYWDPILATEILNYDQLPVINYANRMQKWVANGLTRDEGAEYVIVVPNNATYVEYANQLKDLRTRQGIITEVYRLDEMQATTPAQIKTWIHNAYNTWDIAPVAFCLMADHGTNLSQNIPAMSASHPYSGTCITDNPYADVTGDNLPDMCFSRLIAQNESELPIFVNKQLDYENNPVMDASYYNNPITALGWQTERWFQICSEAVGGYWRDHGKTPVRINAVYSGSPGSQWSSATNTGDVVTYFGPDGMDYIPATPSELGGWTGGTAAQVVTAVNNGAFILQHRDHGYEQGWGEPDFSTSNVSQMTNVGKLPFVMTINCQTGKFDASSDCLVEAFMRRTSNGENAGAVGCIAPTEVSYSFVNDTYVWGMYDLYDPQFMPDYGPYASYSGNWMPAFGNVAGKYFLYQSSWPYNVTDKDITYTMFTAHCDAFLKLNTDVPQEMVVTHPEVIIAGMTEVSVSAPAGCTISLVTANNEGGWNIIAVAQATGDVQTITIPAQVPPTEVNIVCTGQNYLRYEGVMTVVPADGPYIVFDSKTIHDANNNGQLDFGETVTLDVTLKNVGSEPMDAFDAIFNTTSEYITITNGTAHYNTIPANGTLTVENAFSFTVSNSVPDNTNNAFTIIVHNGDDDFTSNLSMKAFAPAFTIGSMSIDDSQGNNNGRLDAGDHAQLNFVIENEGHSDAAQTTANLVMLSPYITIDESSITYDNFAAGNTMTASFAIAVDESTPNGYTSPMVLNVTSGNYNASKDFSVKVGLIVEDFESGTLSEGWTNDATYPWTFDTSDPYEGTKCMKSGAISSNGITTLLLQHEAGSSDTISFYYKVSSEANYDKLHFYIDNVEKGTWSGTAGWTRTSYPVAEGNHTYKWTYTKDGSVNSGSDCGWIDYISLPAERIMAGTAGPDVNVCEGNDAQIIGYAIHHASLTWTTAGDGTFSDNSIAQPLYTPGTQDIVNRSVVLTITITGSDGATITDNMTVNIFDNITISNSVVGAVYCAQSEPQDVGVTIEGDYLSLLWTTNGDGTFADATALSTTYTPGASDIANGNVTLTVIAKTSGCGDVPYDVPFEMNPTAVLTLESSQISSCAGEDIALGIAITGNTSVTPGAPDYIVTINGIEYEIEDGATTITLPAVNEAGQYTYNVNSVANQSCTTEYGEGEFTFTVTVNDNPTLTAANAEQSICLGETTTVVLTLTGAAPFAIEATGIEGFTSEGNEYTLTFTPEESIHAMLTNITDANGCHAALETAINIIVIGGSPLDVTGPNDLDVYVTPTSEYTVEGVSNIDWAINPAEAGTLTENGDVLTITWAQQFKGSVVLTATPTDCPNATGTDYNINVRNSYSINEITNQANIYPNPASNMLNIKAEGLNGKTTIEMFNILGDKVISKEVKADNGLDIQLDLSSLTNGTYVINIRNSQNVWTKRIVVEK